MADPVYFSKIANGNAFIFELDAEFIRSYQIPVTRYTAVHKYPSIARDVSMLVPRAVTVAQVTDLIAKSNPLITYVTLIDFFEKDEWKDQKSLTVRVVMQDAHKTMTAQDADLIMLTVVKQMQAIGATIR
jgi:phenylalanyl-tRNA synthetase beta chain